ncbi:MAG TPA: glycosyltransferase family 4 protein [Devosiaceae bacterium]|jgi:glycosyltransferase involved in cell wall biosynthesis|nr:glycosyltransferase family 4 protein [Devosiaceae bacterium]
MLQRAPTDQKLNVMVATPSGGRGQGGVDRVMAALRDELARGSGIRARFLSSRGSGHVAFSPFFAIAFCLRLAFARCFGRVDVVHINIASHGSSYRKMLIAACARRLGIPYVLHLHGAEYKEFWASLHPFLGSLVKRFFEGAAHVIVLGRVWRDFVASRAPAMADRITVVPNATGVPTLPHLGGGDSVHILFLGRIGDRKGVPQLGEALLRMKGLPGWRATIAGDGAVEAARARAAEIGLLDRVAIPGWVGPDDVALLLAQADVLVLPSFAENLPVSVIEGMAAGLAIVATPVGAVEDIVADEQTGLLVPPGDVDALTAALTRLVVDEPLRTRLGQAALAVHRERLDLPPFAASIADIWRAAARSRTRDLAVERGR